MRHLWLKLPCPREVKDKVSCHDFEHIRIILYGLEELPLRAELLLHRIGTDKVRVPLPGKGRQKLACEHALRLHQALLRQLHAGMGEGRVVRSPHAERQHFEVFLQFLPAALVVEFFRIVA